MNFITSNKILRYSTFLIGNLQEIYNLTAVNKTQKIQGTKMKQKRQLCGVFVIYLKIFFYFLNKKKKKVTFNKSWALKNGFAHELAQTVNK